MSLPPLVSVPRLQLATRLSTVNPELLTELAEAVSAFVRQYTERELTSATRTEVHNGPDDAELLLRETPVTSITTVTITDSEGVATSYAGSSFVFESRTGTVRWKPNNTSGGSWFPEGFQNTSVVYVGGYSPIPADIEAVCADLVSESYGVMSVDPAMESEKLGDYQYKVSALVTGVSSGQAIEQVLTPMHRRVLDLYKDWSKAI